ncbi:contact-dependent growth inhibition system immunity protein [Streptomyces mutabilis]|uniref:contact-dependent growth inhibition system immunity protein n=1 Tax=Streptomyces mutabilis TaxID=67332 RepID=UPI0033B9D945
MNQAFPPGHRFHELGDLLASYANVDFTFSDTAEAPGPALSAYLRIAARDPARAATAIRQIDDLLSVGLFSEEIAEEVEHLPHIRPPMGTSVEDCLRVVREHLHRFLQDPSRVPRMNPQSAWEWNERFPFLGQLLGTYFHRDFSYIYASREEALDEYVGEADPEDRVHVAQEIGELLEMVSSEQELRTATAALGLDLLPPRGMTLQGWFESVRRKIAAPR